MTTTKKETTEKYVVIKKHCLNHKVDAVISLTEKQAKNLVGKVRLQSEKIDGNEFAVANGELQVQVDTLTTEKKGLEAEVKKLKAEISLLKKPVK
jgi:cell division protein FtsB